MNGIDIEGLRFGVGCFHFLTIKEISNYEDFNFKGYVEEIERLISGIASINNIIINSKNMSVTMNNSDLFHTPPEMYEDSTFNDNNGLSPHIRNLRIQFDLTIPFRIQKDILIGLSLFSGTERFRIDMIYNGNFPITFVEPIEPDVNARPSDSVVIVREYLISELKNKSSQIKFSAMGPTPFHGDFLIFSEKSDEDWEIKYSSHKLSGYSTELFKVRKEVYADIADAKKLIFSILTKELGFYYSLKQKKSRRYNCWSMIEAEVDELLELQKKTFKNYFRRMFKTPALLNSLFISIAKFEKDELLFNQLYKREMIEIFSNKRLSFYKDFIEKEQGEELSLPTQQFMQLINLFETRRLNLNEILALIISAIAGGSFGALLTMLLSK